MAGREGNGGVFITNTDAYFIQPQQNPKEPPYSFLVNGAGQLSAYGLCEVLGAPEDVTSERELFPHVEYRSLEEVLDNGHVKPDLVILVCPPSPHTISNIEKVRNAYKANGTSPDFIIVRGVDVEDTPDNEIYKKELIAYVYNNQTVLREYLVESQLDGQNEEIYMKIQRAYICGNQFDWDDEENEFLTNLEKLGFTSRELQIVPFLHLSYKEIAERFFIAQATAEKHVENMRGKIDAHTNTRGDLISRLFI